MNKEIEKYNVNINNNGEKKVYFIPTKGNAHKVIEQENIDWSYAKTSQIQHVCFSMQKRMIDIAIYYFNKNNELVASYGIDTEVLTILKNPQPYNIEFISNNMIPYAFNNLTSSLV